MTLTKAVEAAKIAAFKYGWNCGYKSGNKDAGPYSGNTCQEDMKKYREDCSALPDKPKSEDEILKIIEDGWKNGRNGYRDILKALKAANVLYVEEK